jgi:hypothetical protein
MFRIDELNPPSPHRLIWKTVFFETYPRTDFHAAAQGDEKRMRDDGLKVFAWAAQQGGVGPIDTSLLVENSIDDQLDNYKTDFRTVQDENIHRDNVLQRHRKFIADGVDMLIAAKLLEKNEDTDRISLTHKGRVVKARLDYATQMMKPVLQAMMSDPMIVGPIFTNPDPANGQPGVPSGGGDLSRSGELRAHVPSLLEEFPGGQSSVFDLTIIGHSFGRRAVLHNKP